MPGSQRRQRSLTMRDPCRRHSWRSHHLPSADSCGAVPLAGSDAVSTTQHGGAAGGNQGAPERLRLHYTGLEISKFRGAVMMMSRARLSAAIGAMTLMLAACGGNGAPAPGTPMPVLDGTYFRYAELSPEDSRFPKSTTFRFEAAGDDTYRFIETFRIEPRDHPESAEENVFPVLIVRADGVVLRFEDGRPTALGEEQTLNRRAKIWLPRDERVPGTEVQLEGFPGSAPVSEPRSWRRWSVVTVAPHGYEYYFDRDSGFLVGWREDDGDTWVLDQTNAAGVGR